jgi:DNA-binding HxlR family transcriptional regulator
LTTRPNSAPAPGAGGQSADTTDDPLPAVWPPPPASSDPAWDRAAALIGVLGAKWVLRVMRALQDKPLRHNELMRRLPGIHPTVLAGTLRRLQAAGMIDRHVHPGQPPGVSYQLTTLARDALPLITLLARWVDDHSVELNGRPVWEGERRGSSIQTKTKTSLG